MRDFVNSHMGVALYLVRVPTRLLMIFLGAKNAPLHDVLYVLLFSLILVAWIKNAPTTLLRSSYSESAQENWIERLNVPLLRRFMIHIGSAILMTVGFYTVGKLLF